MCSRMSENVLKKKATELVASKGEAFKPSKRLFVSGGSRRTRCLQERTWREAGCKTLLLLEFGKKTRCDKSWSPLNLAISLMLTRRDFITEDFPIETIAQTQQS